MLPDQDIEPAEYWAELTKHPRPHVVVDFPRYKLGTREPIARVAIVVLTQGETMAANAAAERTARKMLKEAHPNKGEESQGYSELFQLAASAELLVRACRRADDPSLKRPFFRAVDDVHQYLTPDEVGALVQAYIACKVKFSPTLTEMESEDEMNAWLEVIFKGGNYSPLFSASLARLIQSVIFMGSRLFASPTDRFSAGSSPDSLATSTSNDPTAAGSS